MQIEYTIFGGHRLLHEIFDNPDKVINTVTGNQVQYAVQIVEQRRRTIEYTQKF